MIDIVGNIKVNESLPERTAFLVACIRSYNFLKDTGAAFYLNLDTPSPSLYAVVDRELRLTGLPYFLTTTNVDCYGDSYNFLMNGRRLRNGLVINFMEDQFMVIDNPDDLMGILKTMVTGNADICTSGFNQVEMKSAASVREYLHTGYGIVYENNIENFTDYCRHYGSRYYIGVNFITTRAFCLKFWGRDCGRRPHLYELPFYDKDWLHRVMIPRMEIQAAIDDNHGEPGTCLLAREEPKFQRIITEIMPDLKWENNRWDIPGKSLTIIG